MEKEKGRPLSGNGDAVRRNGVAAARKARQNWQRNQRMTPGVSGAGRRRLLNRVE